MKYDLTNPNDIELIVSEVYSPSNDKYRRAIDAQWRIHRGELKFFVEKQIELIYPKTHASFTASEINWAKKITDKRAVAYKEEPIRRLINDLETDFYEQVLWDAKAKWVWRDFDTYRNYFKYACIWFSFYEKEGEQVVKLRALRPNQFSRIVNDKDETEVFIVHLGNGGIGATNIIHGDGIKSNIQDQPEDNTVKTLGIWTKDQHVVVEFDTRNKGISIKPVEGNEAMINELGVIPALFDQEGSAQELPALNPLASQTIGLNYILSTIVTSSAAQGFGQLIVSHPQEQTVPDTLQQGLFTFLKLPQMGQDNPATTADYISPSPDLTNMLSVYRNYVADVLEEHGVTGGEGVSGKTFTSGLDRLLSEMDTTEIVEMNQESYAGVEDQLFKIFKAFYSVKGVYQFKSEDLSVTYKKPKPMQSEKELLEIIKQELDLGLIEKWEALIKLNPNMSREDAIAKIEKIEQEKNKKMESFLNANFQEGSNKETQPLRFGSGVLESEEQGSN